MPVLGIETSGKVASCAVCDGEKIICEKILYTQLTHSQIILPMVKEVMSDCDVGFDDLECIAVACGPGSYTGLRIGIAAVKGICTARPQLKCAGISTLEELAFGCADSGGKIYSVMKARPGVVYAGGYFSDGGRLCRFYDDRVVGEEQLAEEIFSHVGERVLLTGDGCGVIKEKYFSDKDNVCCAPPCFRMPRASLLCAAYYADTERAIPPQELTASYLQQTRADKAK